MQITESRKIIEERKQIAALRAQGRPDKALARLRKAISRWSDHPALIADLATIHVETDDFPQAEKHIESLLQISGNDAATLKFVADLKYSMRRAESALATYEKLLKVAQDSLDAWLKKVEILERQGQLPLAEEALERALALDPSSEEARFMQGLLAFRSGRWQDALEKHHDLLTSGLRNREIQWKAGHQLAATLAKIDEYEDSIQVLQAVKTGMENDYAKEIKAARTAFANKSAAIRKLTAELTASDIQRWRSAAEDAMPVAILAGHPRSGTTLLESILDRHRDISSVEETVCLENAVFRSVYGVAAAQPGLFNADFLNKVSTETRGNARRDYLDSARGYLSKIPPRNHLILDKNPMLTHFLGVVARFFPNLKSIVALRDPRDVCLSCFQQPVGVVTSNVAWLRIDDTMHAYNDIMGVWLKMRQILPDGWLEVRYEDLVDDTAGISRQAFDFLGLPWQDEVLLARNQQRTVFSPTYADASKPVYRSSIRRWEAYEEFLSPHLPILNNAIKELGY